MLAVPDIIFVEEQSYIAEVQMPNNLQYYYKVLNQLGHWLPEERITRLRNLALLIVGLHLSGAIHLGLIVRKWLVVGKIPSLVNRLHRFLVNPRVRVRDWHEPITRPVEGHIILPQV